jgi:hypothetical protein
VHFFLLRSGPTRARISGRGTASRRPIRSSPA